MASLILTSDNPNFSFMINKNPNSGMKAKHIRNDTIFGWYYPNNSYNIVFFDGNDEISFKQYPNQEYDYCNENQYNSPLFIMTAINQFFSLKKHEKDISSNCSIVITSVKINRLKYFERIIQYFPKFKFNYQQIYEDNYTLTILGTSIYELLNLTYLLAFFLMIDDYISFNKDKAFALRLIKCAQVINAPYYIRYLIKCYAVLDSFYKDVKNELENSKTEIIKFTPNNNADIRFKTISSLITRQYSILDFGCGDGYFLKLAPSVPKYYCVDKNNEVEKTINNKIQKYGLTNVNFSTNMPIINENYEVILTEVFEHNELNNILAIMNKWFNDINCKQIILTTPNKDFNQFYLLKDNELRHPDHKFELTKQQLTNIFNNIPEWHITIKGLGDTVNDIPTTFLVIFRRNENESI